MKGYFIALIAILGIVNGTYFIVSDYINDSVITTAKNDLLSRTSEELDSEWFTAKTNRYLAQILFKKGAGSVLPEDQLRNLCSSRRSLESALEDEPLNGVTLLAWAEVNKLLEAFHCEDASSEDPSSYEEREKVRKLRSDKLEESLLFIKKWFANNPATLFSAGRIATLYGLNDTAIGIFREYLKLAIYPNPKKSNYLARWLATSSRFESTIPDSFPAVIFWSARIQHLLTNNELSISSSEEKKLINAMSIKQRESLHTRIVEYQDGSLPLSVFYTELLRLSKISASDEVRSDVDKALIILNEEEVLSPSTSEFLEARLRYQKLSIIAAVKEYDFRPIKGNLSEWGSESSFVLDSRRNSIGFFLGEGQALSMITLTANGQFSKEALFSLQLYSSEDNANWINRTSEIQSKSVYDVSTSEVSGLKPVVGFIMRDPVSHRFWKIHYTSKIRNNVFTGAPGSIINVYGKKRDI